MSLQPVVFLPGLICDAQLWRAQVDALADVAAPFVADLTLDSSVKAMAARTLAAAPPKFALVGLSMGGYVAFEIMRQAPERVEKLALFSTSALADSPEATANRRAAMAQIGEGKFKGVTGGLLPKLIHPSRIDGPVGDIVREMAERVGGDAFFRQQEAIIGRPDSRATLATIDVPTFMAVGEDDVLTPPEQAQIIHQGIAGSTYHKIDDCGHLPPLEQPEEASRLLREWLAG